MDIPVLQECLRIIVQKQKAVEKDIVDTEKSIAVTENVLKQQKKILLANELMTTQLYLQACEADFVEMFYVHVTKDIQNKNLKLDVLQLKVNELKRSGQDAEKLRKYKKERDDLHETIQKLLTVREAIRNHLYRPFVRRKKKQKKVKISENEASLHTMFKEVHESLMKDKDLLKRLCYRKLHAASVREAIESTVNMLKQNSSGTLSLGDFSEFSVYLGTKREDKQQWESMQARVDGWMSGQSDLCRVHMDGCQLVQDLSVGMISDSRIASIGLDPSEIELQEIGEGGRQSAGDAEDPEGELSAFRFHQLQCYRSVCLSACLSICCLRLSLSVSVSVSFAIFISLYIYDCNVIGLFVSLSACPSAVCLSLSSSLML